MENFEKNDTLEFDLIDAATIKRMGRMLWRYGWVIVLAAVALGSAAFIYSRMQTPIYQSSTQVMITRPTNQGQLAVADITAQLNSQQLAQTYVELLRQPGIRQEVSQRLETPVTGAISASVVTNTQIINITVTDTIPARAKAIADMLVTVLIEQNDNIQSGRYEDAEANINKQIAQMEQQLADQSALIDTRYEALLSEQKTELETQIADIKTQIAATQQDINAISLIADGPSKTSQLSERNARLSELQKLLSTYEQTYTNLVVQQKPITNNDDELSRLEKAYNLYQQIYLNLLNNRENLRLARLQDTPNVVQLDEARAGAAPISPRTTQNTLIGLIAGAVLAIAGIFIRDFLDDTFKSRDDVKRLLGLNVMGSIGSHEAEHGDLYVATQPRSPVSESYRALRTNLEFAGVDHPVRVILVTSANPGEGKSTVAANLAGILSQNGREVLLLDCDLRRPNVHRILDLPNRFGMTELFRSHHPLADVVQKYEGANGTTFSVITTGAIPPNPSELLSSARMKSILDEAAKFAEYVIIDSAPSLVTDAQVLAGRSDGILLVVHAGETHAEPVRSMVEGFRQIQGRILGIVLNRMQPQHGYYYGKRGYNGYYNSYDSYGSREPSKKTGFLGGLFNKRKENPKIEQTSSD